MNYKRIYSYVPYEELVVWYLALRKNRLPKDIAKYILFDVVKDIKNEQENEARKYREEIYPKHIVEDLLNDTYEYPSFNNLYDEIRGVMFDIYMKLNGSVNADLFRALSNFYTTDDSMNISLDFNYLKIVRIDNNEMCKNSEERTIYKNWTLEVVSFNSQFHKDRGIGGQEIRLYRDKLFDKKKWELSSQI